MKNEYRIIKSTKIRLFLALFNFYKPWGESQKRKIFKSGFKVVVQSYVSLITNREHYIKAVSKYWRGEVRHHFDLFLFHHLWTNINWCPENIVESFVLSYRSLEVFGPWIQVGGPFGLAWLRPSGVRDPRITLIIIVGRQFSIKSSWVSGSTPPLTATWAAEQEEKEEEQKEEEEQKKVEEEELRVLVVGYRL